MATSKDDKDNAPSDPAQDERRVAERHLTCYPAHVEANEGDRRLSLIHDLSITGALLFTRGALKVDERLKLHLFVSDGAEPLKVEADVIRVEARPLEISDLWTHSAAVRFSESLEKHEKEIDALAEQRAKALGSLNSALKA